jgi:micrococcal nuclease
MWLLSLVFAVVFVLLVYYALSYYGSNDADRRVSLPIAILAAIVVLAAVGGLVLVGTGGTPPSFVPGTGTSPTASPQQPGAGVATATPTAAPATPAPTATPQSSTPAGETPTPTAADATARLVHVVDGDTVTVRHADGRLETYSLAGVDAPATGATDPRAFAGVLTGSRGAACLADFGRRATVYLRTNYLDRPVDVSPVPGDARQASVSVGNTSLNRVLVARGYARADGDYAELEARARAGELGLWSCRAVTFPPTDDDGVAITKVHPNPVGPDGTNLDGEYVVVENVGSRPVDLSNWYLVVDDRTYFLGEAGDLLPSEKLTIRAGSGRDASTGYSLDAANPILPNDHAVVTLRDGDNVRNVSVEY